MIWFEGNIAEAVALSKAKNAIFVVYVMGEDESSTEMLEMMNGDIITTKLANENHFLAIKLDGGSEHYTNFARIYQFVPVPSLFFIGRNGTPLEVVCPGIEPTDLARRIDKILQEHLSSGGPQVLPSGSGMNVRQQAQSFLEKEAMMQDRTAPTSTQADVKQIPPAPVPTEPSLSQSPTGPTPPKLPRTVEEEDESEEKEEKEEEKKELPVKQTGGDNEDYEVVCEGDVCVRRPKQKEQPASPPGEVKPEAPSTSSVENQEPTIDEKVERAKEIIEKRRLEKIQQEKEEEKKKELERRAVGQGVAELKKWQHEQELKQLQEERKREKMEESRARARILEQIAQDRAERRALEARAGQSNDATTAPSPSAAPASSSVTPPPAAPPSATHARVQFKMPDGSTVTAQFDADATIGDLRQYLLQNVRTLHSPISIWSTFPRHELADDTDTLRALGLLPAVALIVHQSAPAPIVAGGGLVGVVSAVYQFLAGLFLTLVLQPGRTAWHWLTGSPRRGSSSPSTPPADEAHTRPPARDRNAPRGQGDVDGVRYRPEGNIHRLRGDRSSDDENNTWNGNSTQQM